MSQAAQARQPLEAARRKTEAVQADLQVAGAELTLTNAALARHLPDPTPHSDLDRALEQNLAIEEKVLDAADELAEVKELLAKAAATARPA